jgi:hypothetical protein
MPVAGGPNTLGENNLVFAYDTGDVKNSYKGQPTTNLANTNSARTMFLHYGSHAMTFADAPERGDGWKKVTVTTVNGDNNRLSQFPYITSAIGQRTYSVEYDVGALTTYSWKLDGSGGYEIIPITGQGKFQFTVTHGSVGSFALFLINGTAATGLNHVIYYRYYQVEDKPTATPFTAGTRSATQGLLPVIGTSSIDLTNVSFDSNAKMVFDGTNDYMVTSTAIPCNFGTGDFTVEVLIYPESFASYAHMVALPNQSTFALKANISDGVIYYYDPAFSTYGSTSGWTLTLNQWNHVILTRSGNVAYAYLNGVPKGSKTGFNTNFSSTQIVNVGNGGVTEYTQKKIDVVKIYNRALTAQEVSQNYQQYKTRFNLS